MPPISAWWKFITTDTFDDDWRDLGLEDEDLARLELVLVNDPHAGDVIAGTSGLRKLRFAREGEGKSGGCRVCYAFFPDFGVILLVFIYGKTKKKDLNTNEKAAVKQLLDRARVCLRNLANGRCKPAGGEHLANGRCKPAGGEHLG